MSKQKRSYFCECHGKQIGPSSHVHEPLREKPPNQSLGTWHCPISGRKCKVTVKLNNEAKHGHAETGNGDEVQRSEHVSVV